MSTHRIGPTQGRGPLTSILAALPVGGVAFFADRTTSQLDSSLRRTREAQGFRLTARTVPGGCQVERLPGVYESGRPRMVQPIKATDARVECARALAAQGVQWAQIFKAVNLLPGVPFEDMELFARRMRTFGIRVQSDARYSAERVALARKMRGEGRVLREIFVALNALPGAKIPTLKALQSSMSRLGIPLDEASIGALPSPYDPQIRELWAEGLSGQEIGRRLGVTKNVVLGRAHRMKLPQREHAVQPKWTAQRDRMALGMTLAGHSTREIFAAVNALPGAAISSHDGLRDRLVQLREDAELGAAIATRAKPACEWVCCHAPAVDGRYCAAHAERGARWAA